MAQQIAFGADDDNEVVAAVRSWIDEHHVLVEVDAAGWPSMAHGLATAVAQHNADLGVVMCWTGTGTAIAANKVAGIRAAQAHDAWVATNARRWNDANVLALSSRRLSADQAVECVRAFVETDEIDPDEGERIDELKALG
ncbi:MAG: RpiB/LacA/LacB family sugar-phosphate isomerase [Actinomycetota bacterium]